MTTNLPDVLVVEDDELVREYLGKAVESLGKQCVRTGSARDAIRALEAAERAPSVILIDGLLPDMHGAELARQILEDPRWADCGICFVSGALRSGPNFALGIDALPKPVHRADLVACLVRMSEWKSGSTGSTEDRAAVLRSLTDRFLIAP
jgi:CheY-like chemotaxis protein